MHRLLAVSAFLLLLSSWCSCDRLQHRFFGHQISHFDGYGATSTFSVIDYGAVGDGTTDDSEAFTKAWQAVCSANVGIPTLDVPPSKTFLLQTVLFQGPCKANSVHFQLRGNLVAPIGTSWSRGEGMWIGISGVKNLIVDGGGQIDGRGSAWWGCAKNRAQGSTNDCNRPTALHFNGCDGLKLSGLHHLNSAKNHVSISSCNGVTVTGLTVTAPGDSPNTDGFDISKSTNVNIMSTIISTGDDCVAINGGSSNINITGVHCGPGHGISIGSLGYGGAYDTVEGVNVAHCNFTGTQNGARIKTWQGGKGYARNITFQHIILDKVSNPIIIDQFYHPFVQAAGQPIQIIDVTYNDVVGTSASEEAISFKCSNNGGCKNIMLQDVKIKSAVPGKSVDAVCQNAQGVQSRDAIPTVQCSAQ